MTAPRPIEQNNVVPISDSTALDRPVAFLEELNVVRLEGRYFCFDKHEAKKNTGIYTYEDGDRGIVIETNPRYGQPSIVAYKVLQAVFRKITLEGKPYPETVSFSYRELSRMIGRDVMGGRNVQQLVTAIRQLQNTQVMFYVVDPKSGKKPKFNSTQFPLIIGSGFIGGEGAVANPTRINAAVLTVHPIIMDSMRRGHFAIFNWARLSDLEPVAAAIYKRVYLHLSNLYENQYATEKKDKLVFQKRYSDICAEWLGGLKPEKYKSRIEKQLGHYIEALKATGLIRSATIEKTADGGDFKIVFNPAKGFFYDYDHFYAKGNRARLLQFQEAADRVHLKEPYALVRSFYKLALRADDATLDEMVFPEKDITVARELLSDFGMERCNDLIAFATEEAPKTNFQMKSIAAVKTYLPAWQAKQGERARSIEARRQEDQKRQKEKLESEYESFIKQTVLQYFERSSPEEHDEIQRLAAAKIDAEFPPRHPMRKMAQTRAERALILERCTVPDFATWLKTRE